MSVARIAGRYAKSLIDLAQEQNKLDTILGDMNVFQSAIENRELFLMLKSPIINASKKRNVIEVLFGKGFDKMSMAFMNIVLSKGREAFLPEICQSFIQQYRELKNITTATVISATELNPETLDKIKTKIQTELAKGSSVEIVTKVNSDLLGGFVIEIGDKLYDASISTKLKNLRKQFTGSLN